MEIRALAPGEHVDELAAVLHDCVDGGASVGYLAPFSLDEARTAMAAFSADEQRVLLAAFDEGELVGTAQLIPSPMPNQPHRADVAKVLVKRSARGRGVASRLMDEIDAYRLYTRLGWERVGPIPDYALMPDGAPCETTVFYKALT